MTLPNPRIDETYEDFITRSMSDPNMIREYMNPTTRLATADSRWIHAQFSRMFEIAIVETPTVSLVSDPSDSKGKTLPDYPEPLTDGEVQKY